MKLLSCYHGDELLSLVQLRIISFSKNTWSSNISGLKKYRDFCLKRNVEPFLVDMNQLQLCLIEMVKNHKSTQILEHLVNSVIFSSNFLGWSLTSKERSIKDLLKCVSKLTIKSCKRKHGIDSKDLNILWDKIRKEGDIESLSLTELRTCVLMVFCFHTLCRFSCAQVIETTDLKFHKKYFDVKISRSKTDQAGHGQNLILTKYKSVNDPHLLLCVYLNAINPSCKDQFLFPPLKWDPSSRSWVANEAQTLSYSAAYQSFKKLLNKFGLDVKKYGLHSPRIGGTTKLFQKNVSKRLIDRMGRWKSSRSKYIYGRDSNDYIAKQLRKLHT